MREKFASALFNAIVVFRKKSIDNILLLFKIRFDLPSKINVINDLVVTETTTKLLSEYNNEMSNFKEFIQKIKAVISDETELVLFMNEISDRVPLNIQKLIWNEILED